MQKNIVSIKENINILYTLARNEVKEKSLYKPILQELEEYLPDPKEISSSNSMTYQLNQHMENLKQKINNVTKDPLSKIDFWVDYMYWSVWKTFRDNGIGHLYDFKIEHSCIHCCVNIDMYIHKEYNETKEEHEKRKEKFYKKIKDAGIIITNIKSKVYLTDNEHNKNYIVDFIKQFCEPIRVEFTTRDSIIKTVCFVITKDGNFSFTKKNEYKTEEKSSFLTDLNIEKIVHDTKEWYQSILLLEELYSKDSILLNKDFLFTSKHLSLTIYHSICEMCDVNNELIQKYNKFVMPNKDSNIEARIKEEEIGSSYEIETLIDILKKSKDTLESVLRKNYCLYLDNFIVAQTKQIVLRFNSYYWHVNKQNLLEGITLNQEEDDMFVNILKVKETIDITDNDKTQEAYIEFTEKNIHFFEKILSQILYSDIKDIKISYRYGIKYISEITFELKDTKSFLEKFY
jgi:hypothetical protein